MNQQKAVYSSYREMHSFKVIVGVAPNVVITYVSKLYPGSISSLEFLWFYSWRLNFADKGFLIHDIVPSDVAVNIPPFLNQGKFTES